MARRKLSYGVPLLDAHPGKAEIWFWGLCIFLLTTPFMFNLTGQDPHAGVARNLLTMSAAASGTSLKAYLMRLGVTVIALAAAWRFLTGSDRWVPRVLPLLLFSALSLISTSWTDSVRTTGLAAIMQTAAIVSGVSLAARLPPHLFARAMVYSGVFMAAFSLIWVVALPRFGVHQESDASQAVHAGAWRGVYMHKNMLGQTAAVYAVLILCSGREVIRSLRVKAALLAVMLALLVKADSMSALVIVAASPVLMWCAVSLNAEQRMMIMAVVVPVGISLVLGADSILAMMGRDLTFSGRTRIWEQAPHAIAQSPLLGFGFESPNYGGFVYRVYSMMGVTDAHNGYIELLLGLGAVGLLMLSWCIYAIWRQARRMYEAGGIFRQGAMASFAVTTAWLVACLSESDMRPMGPIPSLGFVSAGILLYHVAHAAKARARPNLRARPGHKAVVAQG